MSKLTPERKAKFLKRLAEGFSVTSAASSIAVTRQAVYQLRGHDEEFAGEWDDAIEAGTDRLEDEAVKRAKKKSDLLLIFTLKARRPEKFKERSTVEHTGSVDLVQRLQAGRDRIRAKG